MSATGPVQETALVLGNDPVGAYRLLVLAAPGAGAHAEPGQFVALAVGDRPTATLLRRCFSVHAARTRDGGPTVELVVAAHGPGSTWLARRRVGDAVDLVGPLGRPFPLPAAASPAVLVGGGYGSAPLTWFAQVLQWRGSPVSLVLGAGDAGRLFGVEQAAALGADVHVTTDDGSAGTRGRVSDVLPEVLRTAGVADVYACGPMAMLRAVADVARAAGARAWVTVEESMACGIGVCMTCVLPVRGGDGLTRMVRSCVEGPTFAGEAVRWEAVLAGPGGRGSLVPADCVGAPRPTGGHG